MHDGTAILIIDKGTPNQKAYPFQPGDVFNIGKAFISIARNASKARSHIVRN